MTDYKELITRLRDYSIAGAQPSVVIQAADALEALTAGLQDAQQLCYCGKEISLQMVSGGAAADGLHGRITCKMGDGTYQDYVRMGAAREPVTTPKDAEPVAWAYQEHRRDFMVFDWFDEVQFVQPPNDPIKFRNAQPLYSAETVARLIAERDAAEHHAQDMARLCTRTRGERDTLQAQVKELHRAGLKIKERLDRNGIGGRQLPEYPILAEALAATEPKGLK